MTVEQFVSILAALTALVGAVAAVLVQVRATHVLVNSRMTQLLELTATSSIAQGKLEGPGPAGPGPGPSGSVTNAGSGNFPPAP